MNQLKCRLCSEEEVNVKDIFGPQCSALDIPQKINSYLALHVREDDGFSTFICIICLGKIENFHNFALNVHEVQNTLTSVKNENFQPELIKFEEDLNSFPVAESIINHHSENVTKNRESRSGRKVNEILRPKRTPKLKRKKSVESLPKKRSREPPTKTKNCLQKGKVKRAKSNSYQIKQNTSCQVGTSLSEDLSNLKNDLNLKHPNLSGFEILTLLPVTDSTLGTSVSRDTKTSKGSLARLNLGVKTSTGKIIVSSSSPIKKSKLPARRVT